VVLVLLVGYHSTADTINVFVIQYISHCQAVAEFSKDYKSRTVPARRDCIFIIALPWGHINALVEFVILKC